MHEIEEAAVDGLEEEEDEAEDKQSLAKGETVGDEEEEVKVAELLLKDWNDAY